MMDTYPDLGELICLFECEPASTDDMDQGSPWYDTLLEFKMCRGADRLDCTIDIGVSRLTFLWWRDDTMQAEIRLSGVNRLQVKTTGKTEGLRVDCCDRDMPLIIQLKPWIKIMAGLDSLASFMD